MHETPEGQGEDEEAEVTAEKRIGGAERHRVDELEERLPARHGAQPGHEGDPGGGQGQEAPNHGFDDRPPGEPELILQFPVHIRGGRASGDGQVTVEKDQKADADDQEKPAAQRQHGQEYLGVADLLEPQPVRVERDELRDRNESPQGQGPEEHRLRGRSESRQSPDRRRGCQLTARPLSAPARPSSLARSPASPYGRGGERRLGTG